MKVNKAMLMIRLINRITAERDYWRAKIEALHENRMFTGMNGTSVGRIKSLV